MTDERNIDEMAAAFVLGPLSGAEHDRFQRQLARDPAARKSLERWTRLLAPLADGIQLKQPPPELWERIEKVIDASEPRRSVPQQATDSLKDLFHFVRASEGEWVTLATGVHKKVLLTGPGGAWETYLLRIDPGHCIPAHHHARLEECLIVEGELRIGDFRAGAGDFHAIGSAVPHPDLVSDTGATVLIRGEVREPAART